MAPQAKILLLSPTGAGKSTFINAAAGQEVAKVGHTLQSCTSETSAITLTHPNKPGCEVILIDTPGFDDSWTEDKETLRSIAGWLKTTQTAPTAIIFLQDQYWSHDEYSTSNYVFWMGYYGLPNHKIAHNAVLVATKWNTVNQKRGDKQLEECVSQWQRMLEHGSKVVRFEGSHKSAWEIIDFLLNNNFPATEAIQVAVDRILGNSNAPISQPSIFGDIFPRIVGIFRRIPSDDGQSNHNKSGYHSSESLYSSTFIYIIGLLDRVKPSRVNGLKAKYEEMTEGVDEINQLVNHQLIYAVLHKHLKKRRSSQDLALADIALKTDRQLIASRIYALLQDRERRKLFMDQKDHRAQSLLNLMQELLDDASLDLGELRSFLTTALIQLSRNSGLYPERLLIKDVTIQDKFASANGRYGDVYEGNLGGRAVAVKTMRGCGFGRDAAMQQVKAFAKEAVLWAQLSSPYVLPFYGVYPITANADRLGLISPWMKNGNLTQYLDKTPQIDQRSLMDDIAFGLDYLHSFDPQVIHGDLKGPNILITDDHRACVADFGLCRLAQSSALKITMTFSSNDGGSLFWMAPELFNGDEECVYKNCATDAYAFGCVCYEIFNGQPPFFDLRPNKARIVIKESRVPPRPTHPDLSDALWILIQKCLRGDPESRPGMSEVVQQLSSQQNN